MLREPAGEQGNSDVACREDGDLLASGRTAEHLLGQLRHHAVQLLSELSASPRAMSLRAGPVSLDLEWDSPETQDTVATQVATVRKTHSENGAGPAAPSGGARSPADAVQVTAPSVGVLYLASEPGAPPFVRVGDTVAAGQQVAIVEVMKLFIPVTVEVPSRVVEVLKNDGDTVEYDEPVLLVSPTDRTDDV